MTAEQRKAVIKNADMSESMQQDAVDCASQALAKYNIEKVRRSTTSLSSRDCEETRDPLLYLFRGLILIKKLI